MDEWYSNTGYGVEVQGYKIRKEIVDEIGELV
jgi:hypothetical protein